MERLGYYAKDVEDNLFQFKWGEDDKFYIFKNQKYHLDNPNNYVILEVGFFTADNPST